MADNAMPSLANILAEPAVRETVFGPFGDKYDVEPAQLGPDPIAALLGLRMGFRGMPQAAFPRGPWTPPERQIPAPTREWKQPGDDSLGQHIYEALLGRVRKPGEAAAKPESGSVFRSPLATLGAPAAGYAVWNAMDGPQAWEEFRNTPYWSDDDIKNNINRLMWTYGGARMAPWAGDMDRYGGRTGEQAGVPPLPGAPY